MSAEGGATFAVEQVSTTDPDTRHWFPHLERPLEIVPPTGSSTRKAPRATASPTSCRTG